MSIIFCCVHYSIAAPQFSIKAAEQGVAEESSLMKIQEYLLSRRDYKTTLTPAQQKLSTDLLQLVDRRYLPAVTKIEHVAQNMQSLKQLYLTSTESRLDQKIIEGDVYVYIHFNQNSDESILEPFNVNITDSDKRNKLAAVWVKVKEIERIAALDGIRTIRTVLPPITHKGSVLTEGDDVHRTSVVRSTFSQGGSGIKVGIISDGVDNRADAQASGDLPADGAGLTVLSNNEGGDEGTAMLEIVHDMVPDANLYFHNAGSNLIAFNSAVDALVSAGCDIVCDDITWINVHFFEDGVVASHVRSVIEDNDIIYVSSAGNHGHEHYQGNFHSVGGEFSDIHDFSHGSSDDYRNLYLNIPSGSLVNIMLQWNDPSYASTNDYNLYLYSRSAGEVVQLSQNIQNGNDDPFEFITYTADSSTAGIFEILVAKTPGAQPRILEVLALPDGEAFLYVDNTIPDDSIFGHAAVPSVVAVGAIGVNDPNDPEHSNIEFFSSQGPVTISYPVADIRLKPDICGVDRVSVTGAGGFSSPFWGTSAAAPHVAAIMAQLWAAMPQYTGDEIRDMVLTNAVDLGEVGVDSVFGYGRADALNAFYSNYTGEIKLTASDGVANVLFGKSVSISNDYLIIGTYESAYIFKCDGSNWTEQKKLLSSDWTNDVFGHSVSISGDYAIVGAPCDDDKGVWSGSAYIFKRDGSSWTLHGNKLTASDGDASDEFGCSVSISGDYAIIGAFKDDDKGNDSGSAYIFKRNGLTWTEQKKLTVSGGTSYKYFGYSVSISGDYAIIGAYIDDLNGSAYVFKRDGSSWTQQGNKLTASDGNLSDEFGCSVSICGDYAIIGAFKDDDKGNDSGSAYIFERNGSNWVEQKKLIVSDGGVGDSFGRSVSISGDYAIVGAGGDNNRKGSTHIFKRNGSNWAEQKKLTASDGAAGDVFGWSVSIRGNYAIVGAPEDDDEGTNSGSAYIYPIGE